jgi:hypothetical protein
LLAPFLQPKLPLNVAAGTGAMVEGPVVPYMAMLSLLTFFAHWLC